jgi:hypothetical protein
MGVEMGSVHQQRRVLLQCLAGAALLALILYLTNPCFSILEDETSMIVAANAPIAQTLHLFATGEGQHEHPPLSDLLLHFWLPVAGLSPSLVRLPSIIFYALALVTFAAVAGKMSGETAACATMVFGMLWPFGFHFGRLAGWYSLCFLLVGLLTLSYLYFLEAPTWGRWFPVLCASFAAVTSNYFSWPIVAFVLLDIFLNLELRIAWRYAVVGLAVLSAAYGPLWTTLAHEIQRADLASVGHNFPGTALNAAFNLYALFVSESVAPWFWLLSIPAAIAIAVVLVATVFLIEGHARRFYFYFLALFGIMAGIGIIGTKRLLFISGWLLVAVGCALANSERPRLRLLLAASLLLTIAIGWAGIFSRRHYAALHYIEPWAVLAKRAAQKIDQGQIVVSNSPSFLFYLNASLHELRPSRNDRPGWASGTGVISLLQSDLPVTLPSKELMFVSGVNTSATERTGQAEEWLMSRCRLESTDHLLRDDGFELKKHYFHIDIDDPYRIRVEHFDCRR